VCQCTFVHNHRYSSHTRSQSSLQQAHHCFHRKSHIHLVSVCTAITITMIPRTSVQSNLATGHIVAACMPCQRPLWRMLSRHCVWYWLCPIIGDKTGRVHRARCARLTHSSKVTIPMRNLDPFVIPCAQMSLPQNH